MPMLPTERQADLPFLGWVSKMVHVHRMRLIGIARNQGVDGDDALDCVQDALLGFMELPQARSLVSDEEGTAKVLSVLTKNVARNHRRRHHRAKPHLSDDETLEAIGSDNQSVDELVVVAERHVQVLGCLAQLRKVQRRVITMRLMQDMPGEDVAEACGATSGHVAVLLHRAKAALRDCIATAEVAMEPA